MQNKAKRSTQGLVRDSVKEDLTVWGAGPCLTHRELRAKWELGRKQGLRAEKIIFMNWIAGKLCIS